MIVDALWWFGALLVCAAPRRVWDRIDPRFPLRRAATAAGVLTLVVGFFFGVDQFFQYGMRQADANNTWMIAQLGKPAGQNDDRLGFLPYGMSMLALPMFLFFTPAGLLATYLCTSGAARAISATVDDPRGDPLLSFGHWLATTAWTKNRDERKQIARTRLEGADASDVLRTGDWAKLHGVDYVVLSARRKPEWDAGAIVMTDTDWYKLGVPFDMETPAGLRTAYPLTKMETVEVVRRGIRYDLPPLRPGKQKAPRGVDPRGA
ncbi:MAG TPA: hypothetical protein VKH42_19765 [Vicinamibacterales bacterium]|nr:hypothetical protein [Vicinamibacterales bacterium]